MGPPPIALNTALEYQLLAILTQTFRIIDGVIKAVTTGIDVVSPEITARSNTCEILTVMLGCNHAHCLMTML